MRIRGAVLNESGRRTPYRESRPLEVRDLDLVAPGPDEVLVEIEAAGVCHSDLSVVSGQRPRPTPMLLGHEAAGRVLVSGADVSDVVVGQRVVLVFVPRCGFCEGCRSDGRLPCVPGSAANTVGELLSGGTRLLRDESPVKHHLGVSAFASHAVVHRSSVVAVDDDIPAEVAALLGCATLTGGGAVVNAAQASADDTVAVVGLGGVGLAALLVAKALNVRQLIAIDPAEPKRELAMSLGADVALTPQEATDAGHRCTVVVEAAGSVPAFETAVQLTAPGGRTVSVGLAARGEAAQLEPLTLVAEGRTIIGSYLGSSVPSRDIPMYAEWWRQGRLPLERLVSARVRLDEINEAMDDLAEGRAVRQIVLPGQR